MEKKPPGLIEQVERVCLVIAGIGLLLLMVLTTVDALLRYFFSAPLTGVLEFSEEYLMIAIIYMPISFVYIAGGHIKVELLERHFPPGIKRIVEKANIFVGLLLFALITGASVPVVIAAIAIGEHSSSALAYPMAPTYMMLTIGCILLCIRAIQLLLGKVNVNH